MEFGGDLRVGVDFAEGASRYDIYAPIGFLNAAAQLPRLLVALELNLYQRGTAGGVIGLDMQGGAFIYSCSFPVEAATADVMASQIERFVGHARRLRATLETAAGDIHAVELDSLADDLGMVREQDAEAEEAGDRIGNASLPTTPMIRG